MLSISYDPVFGTSSSCDNVMCFRHVRNLTTDGWASPRPRICENKFSRQSWVSLQVSRKVYSPSTTNSLWRFMTALVDSIMPFCHGCSVLQTPFLFNTAIPSNKFFISFSFSICGVLYENSDCLNVRLDIMSNQLFIRSHNHAVVRAFSSMLPLVTSWSSAQAVLWLKTLVAVFTFIFPYGPGCKTFSFNPGASRSSFDSWIRTRASICLISAWRDGKHAECTVSSGKIIVHFSRQFLMFLIRCGTSAMKYRRESFWHGCEILQLTVDVFMSNPAALHIPTFEGPMSDVITRTFIECLCKVFITCSVNSHNFAPDVPVPLKYHATHCLYGLHNPLIMNTKACEASSSFVWLNSGLTYPVKHFNDGSYSIFRFNCTSSRIRTQSRSLLSISLVLIWRRSNTSSCKPGAILSVSTLSHRVRYDGNGYKIFALKNSYPFLPTAVRIFIADRIVSADHLLQRLLVNWCIWSGWRNFSSFLLRLFNFIRSCAFSLWRMPYFLLQMQHFTFVERRFKNIVFNSIEVSRLILVWCSFVGHFTWHIRFVFAVNVIISTNTSRILRIIFCAGIRVLRNKGYRRPSSSSVQQQDLPKLNDALLDADLQSFVEHYYGWIPLERLRLLAFCPLDMVRIDHRWSVPANTWI